MTGPTVPPGMPPRAVRTPPATPAPRTADRRSTTPASWAHWRSGSSTRDRTRAVEEHLATCAACRRDLEDLTAVTDLLGEVPPEALLEGPPDGDLVLHRTLRQIRAEAAADRRRRLVPRLAAAAAAVRRARRRRHRRRPGHRAGAGRRRRRRPRRTAR